MSSAISVSYSFGSSPGLFSTATLLGVLLKVGKLYLIFKFGNCNGVIAAPLPRVLIKFSIAFVSRICWVLDVPKPASERMY